MMSRDAYTIPASESLTRTIRYPIEEAIYDVLGGVLGAAEALDVSRQAVLSMLANRPIRHRGTAVKLSEATVAAGCEVPAAELMELVPWRGPERHDPNGEGRRPRRRPTVAPALPSGAPNGGRERGLKGVEARHATGRRRRGQNTGYDTTPALALAG